VVEALMEVQEVVLVLELEERVQEMAEVPQQKLIQVFLMVVVEEEDMVVTLHQVKEQVELEQLEWY
jgi:hypothetical protein